MKKSFIRSSIIVLIQAILPIIVLLIVSPWLINQSTSLKSWQAFFNQNHAFFLLAHIVFYIMLIWLWPKLVYTLQTERTNQQQLHLAMQARWYLVTIFMFIEGLLLLLE